MSICYDRNVQFSLKRCYRFSSLSFPLFFFCRSSSSSSKCHDKPCRDCRRYRFSFFLYGSLGPLGFWKLLCIFLPFAPCLGRGLGVSFGVEIPMLSGREITSLLTSALPSLLDVDPALSVSRLVLSLLAVSCFAPGFLTPCLFTNLTKYLWFCA